MKLKVYVKPPLNAGINLRRVKSNIFVRPFYDNEIGKNGTHFIEKEIDDTFLFDEMLLVCIL